MVAHPDDLEYGAASAVARWTSQGKHVSYVLVTSGEAGIAGQDPAVVGPLREEEERRSAAVVGVSDVLFLGHPDGLIEYGVPLRRDLARAFRQLQPDVVDHDELRPDLGRGRPGQPRRPPGGRARRPRCLPGRRERMGLPASWACPRAQVKDAYVAGTGNPSHFVDVTATIDRGVASLREHRAYLEGLGGDFDPDEFLRNTAGYVGLGAGCDYAVGLRHYPMG